MGHFLLPGWQERDATYGLCMVALFTSGRRGDPYSGGITVHSSVDFNGTMVGVALTHVMQKHFSFARFHGFLHMALLFPNPLSPNSMLNSPAAVGVGVHFVNIEQGEGGYECCLYPERIRDWFRIRLGEPG